MTMEKEFSPEKFFVVWLLKYGKIDRTFPSQFWDPYLCTFHLAIFNSQYQFMRVVPLRCRTVAHLGFFQLQYENQNMYQSPHIFQVFPMSDSILRKQSLLIFFQMVFLWTIMSVFAAVNNVVGTLPRKNMNLPYSLVHMYVLNEFLTTKYFWKKLLQKVVVHIFTLLLIPFELKLVN